jgi:hypothetical protein
MEKTVNAEQKVNGKKILMCALILIALCTFTSNAQEAGDTSVKNSYVYHNVAIYKIRDYKDAYIITYARHDKGWGQVIIPKNWAAQSSKKLTIRNLTIGLSPYMSIYYNSDGFEHIQLTVPSSRAHRVWGMVTGDHFGDNSGATTLEGFEY